MVQLLYLFEPVQPTSYDIKADVVGLLSVNHTVKAIELYLAIFLYSHYQAALHLCKWADSHSSPLLAASPYFYKYKFDQLNNTKIIRKNHTSICCPSNHIPLNMGHHSVTYYMKKQ